MKTNYRFDELVKMIKKNHVDSLLNDVLDMQLEIERLRTKVMDLKARNESLKKTTSKFEFTLKQIKEALAEKFGFSVENICIKL